MKHDITDIGDKTQPKADGREICGAMAQQRCPDGRGENDSALQKFVHLVGYRDPGARRTSRTFPRPTSKKA